MDRVREQREARNDKCLEKRMPRCALSGYSRMCDWSKEKVLFGGNYIRNGPSRWSMDNVGGGIAFSKELT